MEINIKKIFRFRFERLNRGFRKVKDRREIGLEGDKESYLDENDWMTEGLYLVSNSRDNPGCHWNDNDLGRKQRVRSTKIQTRRDWIDQWERRSFVKWTEGPVVWGDQKKDGVEWQT